MTDSHLDAAFQRAAELAAKVPKNLQELAFTRALDEVLGKKPDSKGAGATKGRATPLRSASPPGADEGLVKAIDRTQHLDVGTTTRVADRALKVLQIANDQHDVDGLSANEISEILTAKFRLRTSANAIRMALAREVGTVDIRQRDDGTQVFHLMAPGEQYLATLRAARTEASSPTAAPRRRKRVPATPATKAQAPEAKARAVKKRAGPSPRSGRPGPKAAVEQLAATGFFSTPRTIAQVQGELKHSRGHTYTVQELSPALVRSLRAGALSRRRNADGQYEYSAT